VFFNKGDYMIKLVIKTYNRFLEILEYLKEEFNTLR